MYLVLFHIPRGQGPFNGLGHYWRIATANGVNNHEARSVVALSLLSTICPILITSLHVRICCLHADCTICTRLSQYIQDNNQLVAVDVAGNTPGGIHRQEQPAPDSLGKKHRPTLAYRDPGADSRRKDFGDGLCVAIPGALQPTEQVYEPLRDVVGG
jgi:hypothetical protein